MKQCGIHKHCGVTQGYPHSCPGIRRGCLCSIWNTEEIYFLPCGALVAQIPPSRSYWWSPSSVSAVSGPGDVKMNEKPIPALLHLVRTKHQHVTKSLQQWGKQYNRVGRKISFWLMDDCPVIKLAVLSHTATPTTNLLTKNTGSLPYLYFN